MIKLIDGLLKYLQVLSLIRRVYLGGLIAIAVSLGLMLIANPALAQEAIEPSALNPQNLLKAALDWVESLGSVGAIAFILLYIMATVAFLPGLILTLGGGALFGLIWGSLYVFIGATLGATAAFLVGRYLARNWVMKKIEGNRKFVAIDRAVGKEGLKIVLLTRLSPAFPFFLLNYAYGVTGVSLKDYVIGSLGMIPGTVLYVYLGSLAGSIATIGTHTQPTNPALHWSIRIFGLMATIAVTLYTSKIARRALEEEGLNSSKS
jgi:uncharacterized membrane protein YdjX (TVP38/TMEM64 family)